MELGQEQKEALQRIKEFINQNTQISITLSGSGGTGKTLLTTYIIEYLNENYIPFVISAPTHKAKTVLEYYTGCEGVTLHKLLSLSPKIDILKLDLGDLQFNQNLSKKEMPYKGIVICDECSMINDYLYDLLLETCKEFKSKIIFVGDSKQIAPVKQDYISKVFSLTECIELNKIYRQSEKNGLMPILSELRTKSIDLFQTSVGSEGSLFVTNDIKEFFNKSAESAFKGIKDRNIFESKILAYTNKQVNAYNIAIVRSLFGTEDKFYKGEILQACNNFTYNKWDYYNSMDYIVDEEPKQCTIDIPKFGTLEGIQLKLYDTGDKQSSYIQVVSPTVSRERLTMLAKFIEELRIDAINYNKTRSRSIFWRKYFEAYNSVLTTVDLVWDNRIIKNKSIDRGYAVTVHCSQGSSYNQVYVDMNNISRCSDSLVHRQLQYVALSRTRNNAFIYQK